MWLEEAGTSGDPRDTRVVCGCGKSLLLEQLFQAGRLGFCRGERPWIADVDPAGCKDDSGQPTKLRLLTRSATNAYFPQMATVISLPEAEDDSGGSWRSTFRRCVRLPLAELAIVRRIQSDQYAGLEGYSDEDVFAACSS